MILLGSSALLANVCLSPAKSNDVFLSTSTRQSKLRQYAGVSELRSTPKQDVAPRANKKMLS